MGNNMSKRKSQRQPLQLKSKVTVAVDAFAVPLSKKQCIDYVAGNVTQLIDETTVEIQLASTNLRKIVDTKYVYHATPKDFERYRVNDKKLLLQQQNGRKRTPNTLVDNNHDVEQLRQMLKHTKDQLECEKEQRELAEDKLAFAEDKLALSRAEAKILRRELDTAHTGSDNPSEEADPNLDSDKAPTQAEYKEVMRQYIKSAEEIDDMLKYDNGTECAELKPCLRRAVYATFPEVLANVNRKALQPPHMLLSGPTGVGKTHTACMMAQKLLKIDPTAKLLIFPAGAFSSSWRSGPPDKLNAAFDLLEELKKKGAETIIWFVDEFAKMCNKHNRDADQLLIEQILLTHLGSQMPSINFIFICACTDPEVGLIEEAILQRLRNTTIKHPNATNLSLALQHMLQIHGLRYSTDVNLTDFATFLSEHKCTYADIATLATDVIDLLNGDHLDTIITACQNGNRSDVLRGVQQPEPKQIINAAMMQLAIEKNEKFCGKRKMQTNDGNPRSRKKVRTKIM